MQKHRSTGRTLKKRLKAVKGKVAAATPAPIVFVGKKNQKRERQIRMQKEREEAARKVYENEVAQQELKQAKLGVDTGDYVGESNQVGLRHGTGTYTNQEGFKYQGTWVNGHLREGKLIIDDSIIEGSFENFELTGLCKEYIGDILTFKGHYLNGERNGTGELYLNDGGKLAGSWVKNKMSGMGSWYYPSTDDCLSIEGSWIKGEFKKGKVVSTSKKIKVNPASSNVINDIATDTIISKDPLKSDPFEDHFVFVKESTIKGANEGLFARVNIPKGSLVSIYSGLRIDPEIADNRPWELNGNTMYLDNETVIDIPPEYSSVDTYCASLGHKANHSFKNNSIYKPLYHPRFGDVKSIVAISDIKAGEEILVHYDYEDKDKPEWYKKQESTIDPNHYTGLPAKKKVQEDEEMSEEEEEESEEEEEVKVEIKPKASTIKQSIKSTPTPAKSVVKKTVISEKEKVLAKSSNPSVSAATTKVVKQIIKSTPSTSTTTKPEQKEIKPIAKETSKPTTTTTTNTSKVTKAAPTKQVKETVKEEVKEVAKETPKPTTTSSKVTKTVKEETEPKPTVAKVAKVVTKTTPSPPSKVEKEVKEIAKTITTPKTTANTKPAVVSKPTTAVKKVVKK